MRKDVSEQEIQFYQENGFLIVEDLLNAQELAHWQESLEQAIVRHMAQDARHNQSRDTYYKDVFVQCVNLWKTDARIKGMVQDPRLGKLAADLAGVDGIRLYHDHALVKQPWANPTNWHIDNPMDPFYSRQAIMLWVALDDATTQNGCMYFLPGTHKTSRYDTAYGNLGVAKIDGLLAEYPEWAGIAPVPAEAKAGAGVFINGMIAHAAGPNMSIRPRRALAMLFMPDGSEYNGRPAALPPELAERLSEGDVLDDDEQLPLLYSRSGEPAEKSKEQ